MEGNIYRSKTVEEINGILADIERMRRSKYAWEISEESFRTSITTVSSINSQEMERRSFKHAMSDLETVMSELKLINFIVQLLTDFPKDDHLCDEDDDDHDDITCDNNYELHNFEENEILTNSENIIVSYERSLFHLRREVSHLRKIHLEKNLMLKNEIINLKKDLNIKNNFIQHQLTHFNPHVKSFNDKDDTEPSNVTRSTADVSVVEDENLDRTEAETLSNISP